MNTVVSTLRALSAAVIATASAVPRRRFFAILAAIVILVAIALLVPLPTAIQLRDWATSVGPWFPLAFLGAHIVATVFPFPRTVFTLAAGLLFGPVLGVPLAVAAATISAVIALLLVRAAGWQLSRLVRHPRIDSLDARLRDRGWPAGALTSCYRPRPNGCRPTSSQPGAPDGPPSHKHSRPRVSRCSED